MLILADGYYEQEDHLITYFTDTRNFEVEIMSSEELDNSTDLSGYSLVVLTGFAPGVSWSGIQNIENSDVSVLIVEYLVFRHSYMFDLVQDDYAYFGDNTLEMIDSNHPITQGLISPMEVYDPEYFVLGVGEWSIKPGITELLRGPNWEQISVIADDSHRIVATGMHEIDSYTSAAWDVMDRCVDYLMTVTN